MCKKYLIFYFDPSQDDLFESFVSYTDCNGVNSFDPVVNGVGISICAIKGTVSGNSFMTIKEISGTCP